MVDTTTLRNALRADPEVFLRHDGVTISGGSAARTGRPSGEATFHCHYDEYTTVKGFTTGWSGRFRRRKDRHLVNFSKVEQPPGAGRPGAPGWGVRTAQP